MQSVIGISENLIEQYQGLYTDLAVPEHEHALEQLKRTGFHSSLEPKVLILSPISPEIGSKGGLYEKQRLTS
ncbi:MAG: hypothetical protein GY833_06795 [Aestuariibacter sp.]|nr:hypothetical protein [Aestuariibacter sp.]